MNGGAQNVWKEKRRIAPNSLRILEESLLRPVTASANFKASDGILCAPRPTQHSGTRRKIARASWWRELHGRAGSRWFNREEQICLKTVGMVGYKSIQFQKKNRYIKTNDCCSAHSWIASHYGEAPGCMIRYCLPGLNLSEVGRYWKGLPRDTIVPWGWVWMDQVASLLLCSR